MRQNRGRHLGVSMRDRHADADARIELEPGVEEPQGQQDPQDNPACHEMPEAQAARVDRQRGRLLNLEREALAIAVQVHRDARVLSPAQQVLVDLAVDRVVARQLRQARVTTVKALAPLELLLHLALRLGDARLEGLDQDLVLRQLVPQLLVYRAVGRRFARLDAAGALGLFVAFALALQRVHQVLDLLLDLDDVRVVILVAQAQRVELGLQLSDTRAVLALARDRGGRFGLAEHLPLERRAPDLGFAQLLRRALDARVQLVQARVDFDLTAAPRLEGRRPHILEVLFSARQLVVVFLRLLLDEVERRTAFSRLGRDAFLNEQLRELLRDAVRPVGVVVTVVDPHDVLAHRDDRRALLDAVDDALQLLPVRVRGHPATVLHHRVHDLPPEDDLADVLAPVGHLGRHRGALHQRLEDVLLFDEDAGRGGEPLRPYRSRGQDGRVDENEEDDDHPARVERLVDEGFRELLWVHLHGLYLCLMSLAVRTGAREP